MSRVIFDPRLADADRTSSERLGRKIAAIDAKLSRFALAPRSLKPPVQPRELAAGALNGHRCPVWIDVRMKVTAIRAGSRTGLKSTSIVCSSGSELAKSIPCARLGCSYWVQAFPWLSCGGRFATVAFQKIRLTPIL